MTRPAVQASAHFATQSFAKPRAPGHPSTFTFTLARRVLTPQKAHPLSTPDAPYGHKADGTPRKRPAPTWQNDPAKHAAAIAKRTSTPAPTPAAAPVPSDLPDRIADELEQRLATIDTQAFRLRDQLAQLHTEHAQLTAALHAIRDAIGR